MPKPASLAVSASVAWFHSWLVLSPTCIWFQHLTDSMEYLWPCQLLVSDWLRSSKAYRYTFLMYYILRTSIQTFPIRLQYIRYFTVRLYCTVYCNCTVLYILYITVLYTVLFLPTFSQAFYSREPNRPRCWLQRHLLAPPNLDACRRTHPSGRCCRSCPVLWL